MSKSEKKQEEQVLQSLNDEVLTGLSIEELEDKLEMQILGASAIAGPEIRRFREIVIESV